MVRYLLVVLLLLGMAQAELPNAPSAVKKENVWLAPFKQPELYVSIAAYTSVAFLDVHNTTDCEHSIPRGCYEAYPGHDRYGYYLPLIGMVAAGTYGCQLMLHDHKWWRRTICPGIGIALAASQWNDATHIYYGGAKP